MTKRECAHSLSRLAATSPSKEGEILEGLLTRLKAIYDTIEFYRDTMKETLLKL